MSDEVLEATTQSLFKHLGDARAIAEELGKRADEWGSIRATLVINCKPGRTFHGVFTYDETRSVLWNLVGLLDALWKRCETLELEAAEGTPTPGDCSNQ